MININGIYRSVVALVLGFSLSVSAHAFDPNAPDYRGADNSTSALWVYDTQTGNFELSDFLLWPNQYPLFDNPGTPSVSKKDLGVGALYSFYIPNFVDPLPRKDLRIQVTYDGTSPVIVGTIGNDDSAGFVVGTMLQHVDGLDFGASYFYEDWEILPNPDYELISFFVASGTNVDTVIIDTVSQVPLPAAAYLLLPALAGLGVFRKQGRKAKNS